MDIMVRKIMIPVLELTNREKGDEVRWEEKGSFVYFFLLFLFSFLLHATLVMFQILDRT